MCFHFDKKPPHYTPFPFTLRFPIYSLRHAHRASGIWRAHHREYTTKIAANMQAFCQPFFYLWIDHLMDIAETYSDNDWQFHCLKSIILSTTLCLITLIVFSFKPAKRHVLSRDFRKPGIREQHTYLLIETVQQTNLFSVNPFHKAHRFLWNLLFVYKKGVCAHNCTHPK